MSLLHTAELSKDVVMGGTSRKIYLLVTLMPDGSVSVARRRGAKFVLDVSGSMNDQSHGGARKIDDLKEAVTQSIEALDDSDQVAVYTFNASGSHPVGTQALAVNRAQALRQVERLTASGGTALSPALEPAIASLPADGVWRIVVVTDGDMTVDRDNEQRRALALASSQGAAPLWILGIGRDYDAKFLNDLAAAGKPGSFYSHASDAAELVNLFLDYARRLTSSGSVTDIEFVFSALSGVTVDSAVRLVPDQADLTVDPNGQRVNYQMDTLDLYGQQLLIGLDVPAQNLGLGTHQIGEFTVTYKDPATQRIYQSVELTVTDDEALASPVNQTVMGTMYTVSATRMATMGNISGAQTMLTRAAGMNTMPGQAQQMLTALKTLSSGDENNARAASTLLRQHATRFKPLSS